MRGVVAHETVVAVDMVVLALTLVDVTICAETDAARKGMTKNDSCIVPIICLMLGV